MIPCDHTSLTISITTNHDEDEHRYLSDEKAEIHNMCKYKETGGEKEIIGYLISENQLMD